ncbi:MAG: choice-of-anchor L domain-containing protein [Bacteroidia bacterium]
MKTLFTSLFILIAINVNAQLTFDTSKPIDTLIQDFVGSGVVLSNVTFTGGPQSIGSFNGSSSLVSSQGIIFSSGNVDNFLSNPSAAFATTSLGLTGDADLNAIVGGMYTFDAAVLQFDFVASNNTLLFDYVFASEEYNEYAGSPYNDVFAFLISGPGITGTQNIALIPSTTTPVSINNINNGTIGTGPCVNCAYYHDNTNDTTVAFDGFTVPLTATITLIPGQTYHLKLAVADVADGIFDTGVFLQKYSLRSVNTTSVAENLLDNANVYLNENNLYVNLNNNSTPKVSMYNINGAKVLEAQTSSSTNTFDISLLSTGVYSVVLELNGTTSVKKVVKQ